MKSYYINLDSAEKRRAELEDNFAQNRQDGWDLTRFPAVDTRFVEANAIKGSLRAAEKACFLSHKHLIQEHLQGRDPIFVMEDDAIFGKRTCEVIDRLLRSPMNPDWDILFTDVCVPQASAMLELVEARRQLAARKDVTLLNLAGLPFAGSTAYIVNPRSREKIVGLLNAITAFDVPYDLYLRQLISANRLSGFVFFPFVTSLSGLSNASQIAGGDAEMADIVWNLFRRMIWNERKLVSLKPALKSIDDKFSDDEGKLFAILFGAMASKDFKLK